MQLLDPCDSLGWGPAEAFRQDSITLPLIVFISLDPVPLECANIYVCTFDGTATAAEARGGQRGSRRRLQAVSSPPHSAFVPSRACLLPEASVSIIARGLMLMKNIGWGFIMVKAHSFTFILSCNHLKMQQDEGYCHLTDD